MSALSDKINSYVIETGIEFNQPYALVPNQTGTHTETLQTYWAKSGRNPVYESTVNPPNGSGSWKLVSDANDLCYHRTNGGNIVGRVRDHDWSTGIWVRINSLPTGINLTGPIFQIQNASTSGMQFGWKVYSDNRPAQFTVRTSGGVDLEVGGLTLNTWYLLSARRVGNTLTHYINGQSVNTQTRTATDLQSQVGWGSTINYSVSFNVCNFYMASSSVITPEIITEIYIEGMNLTPTDITITPLPIEVNATMTLGNQKLIDELVKGAGFLHKKINSYAIETGIEFNQSYSLVPTQTGTTQETLTSSWSLAGRAPVYEENIGPNNGKGSWKFENNASAGCFYRNTAGQIIARLNDYEWSLGFWVKFADLPSSVDFTQFFFAAAPATSVGFNIGFRVFANNSQPKFVTFNSGAAFVEIENLNSNQWYFIAARRTGGTLKIYINDKVVFTENRANTGTGSAINFGSSSTSATFAYNISNWFIGSPTVLDETALSDIYDIGKSAALQILSSNINNEITSYNLVRGIRFNENYKDPYTQTGTATQTSAADFTLTGNAPIYDTPLFPDTRDGGWRFTGTSRVRDAGYITNYFEYDTIPGTSFTDWSLGFWSKINKWESTFYTLIRAEASTSNTTDFYITYGIDGTTGKKAFDIKVGSGSVVRVGTDLNLQEDEWYYFALRKYGNNHYLHINGIKVIEGTSGGFLTANTNYLTFGSATGSTQSFTISNLYLATNAVVGETQIRNIWLSRNTLNFNQVIFPFLVDADMLGMPQKGPTATATADIVDPVVIASIGDSTQISTSISVDAEMKNPIILTGQFVLIQDVPPMLVNATSVFPFNIETTNDKIVSVLPAIADAIIGDHKVSERPFTATALLVEPTLDIDENYFAKVMNLDPLVYINDGKSIPTNYGSMSPDSYYSQYIDFEIDSTQEMQAVNNQKSWKANSGGVILREPTFIVQFEGDEWYNKLDELYASRQLSIEFWYYSVGKAGPYQGASIGYNESGSLFSDGITDIAEVYDYFNCGPAANPSFKVLLIAEQMKTYNYEIEGGDAFATWRTYYDATPVRFDWNHIVITYEPVIDPNKVRRYVYLNGAIVGNEILEYTLGSGLTEVPSNQLLSINTTNAPAGPTFGYGIQLGGSQEIKLSDNVLFDEFAYYPYTMSPSTVLDHYSFVKQQSPDALLTGDTIYVDATSGDHGFRTIINFEYQEFPMTAIAERINDPVLTTGYDSVFNAEHMSAEAYSIDPTHQHGSTITHTEFIAYVEFPNAFHLNTIYSDYVQANIAPYRYVTFDSSTPYLDYGSDIDYSVANFVINGTVVNPDFGINGKSVKSTGSYTNGAIVFKESEHFDNWGTGNNDWHSSFWMQRALDDNSTGLRVLWNLNGAYDNQNIILYHYNNKLHLQVNNQIGAPITISTINNINPFDFGLHHFVISHHHNNNKNHLYVYMDGLLIADQDIDTYMVDVINNPIHVGANDEANNFPRLGIGTLITPFVNTALPVVPTNISVYFDEIYWDKNEILAPQVAALFSAMPNKIMAVIFGTSMTASALMVMPTFITTANYLADPMIASVETGDHAVFAVLNNVETAAPMTAFADMFDAARIDNVNISAEFMFASAFVGGAGTPRVVNVAAFTATADLANRRVLTGGITVNGIKIFDPVSPWVQYIKITNESSLLPMDGVR